jgi:hypothetical protein
MVGVNQVRRSSSPSLAFNFMPVSFSANRFDGGLVEYASDPEQFARLSAELAGSHVVAKTRDGIACVPLATDAELFGKPTTFATRDYQSLTMRLVQEALLRSVLGWGYKPPAGIHRPCSSR